MGSALGVSYAVPWSSPRAHTVESAAGPLSPGSRAW
jgi:hypothetical protein